MCETKKESTEIQSGEIINSLEKMVGEIDAVEEERKIIKKIILNTDKELEDYEKKLSYISKTCPRLDMFDIEVSDIKSITVKENSIIHHKTINTWETCIIRKALSSGIYNITFRRVGTAPVIIGLVDASYECPKSNSNIIDSGEGIGITIEDTLKTKIVNKVKNDTYISSFLLGVGICLLPFEMPAGGALAGLTTVAKRFIIDKVDFNTTIRAGNGKEIPGYSRIEDKDDIKLEINLMSTDPAKRTMYFYTNNKQNPVMFNGLPSEINFAISLKDDNSEVEFIKLEELEKQNAVKIEKMKDVKWYTDEKN